MPKMRHNCETQGCFNVKHRPKIEVFDECFPGRIAMGDIDGIVEINSNFLLLEWKSKREDIPAGQRIMYQRMTLDERYTVLVVYGDAETMAVRRTDVYRLGRCRTTPYTTLDALKARVTAWADRAGATHA